MTGPAVSLVVCTRNRAERVADVVVRVRRALEAAPFACEGLVVDSASTDATPDVLAAAIGTDPLVRAERVPQPGLSRARTHACAAARGEVIVFTDDDVEFDAAWLAHMAGPVLEGTADAVSGRVRLAPELDSAGLSPTMRVWLAENLADTDDPPLVGAAMALHRRLLAVAGWDPDLGAGAPRTPFGEERLFELMVRTAGARLVAAEGEPVVHRPDTDRLTRESWVAAAAARGRTDAYIAHHWEGLRPSLLELRAARNLARRLALGRTALGERLLVATHADARSRELLRLRGTPRRYADVRPALVGALARQDAPA